VLREVTATRYVAPLREGGSLPGLMEADDLGTYVVKFTGAGQGRKALVAEIVCTTLAREFGLPVPDLVLVDVDPMLAPNEPDEEVQDLLRRSAGRNLGVDFLPGALDLDPNAFEVDPGFAGRVLWFDAWIGNVDRTWRNPNLLFWHGVPYLIDHGAALTFHHAWTSAVRPYDAGDHALIVCSPDVSGAETAFAPRVDERLLAAALDPVPDDFWSDPSDPAESRRRYTEALLARFEARRDWLPALAETAAAGGRERVLPKYRLRGRSLWGGQR
jgi:hypothetical protein